MSAHSPFLLSHGAIASWQRCGAGICAWIVGSSGTLGEMEEGRVMIFRSQRRRQTMITWKSTASAGALILGMLCGSAAAQIAYVGSSTIGEHVIPQAAKAFAAKTGILFSRIETQGSGKGLEMVLRGEAQL